MNILKIARVLGLLVLLGLLMGACAPAVAGPGLPPDVDPIVTPPAGDAGDPLAGSEWTLSSLGPLNDQAVAAARVTLIFGKDGKAGGTGGCNSYGGDYQVTGNTVAFSQVFSTLMACMPEETMQLEQRYLEALGSATTFEVRGDKLTITYNNGQSALHFTRAGSVSTDATPE